MSKPFVPNDFPTADDLNDLVGVYERFTAAVDVVSSTIETPLCSKGIGAGHMGIDRMLRLTLLCDYLDNVGTNALTFRVKLGGTTLVAFTTAGATVDADRRPFELDCKIANLGAGNVNFVKGSISDLTGAVLVGASGLYFRSSEGRWEFSSSGTTAIDTSVARTLEVTVQHSVSSASVSFRRHYGVLELL